MKLPITLQFDKFISLTETMFESNPNIIIQCLLYDNHNDEHIPTTIKDVYALSYIYWHRSVTITSIEVRLPQSSIGDVVMIVDTGEIGKVRWLDKDWTIWIENFWDKKPYELVKIPTDLFPLLKDNGTTTTNS